MANEDLNKLSSALTNTQLGESKIVSFAGKGLKMNEAVDATEVIDAIEKCPGIEALRLDGNTLGIDAAKVIGDALSKHKTFKRALWSDMFTGRMKTEIPPALQHLGAGIMTAGAQLTELDLSDNAFGPNGMKGLVDLLPSASCYTLQVLKLNNNGLGPQGGKMLAECLTKCYEAGSKVNTPLKLKVFVSGRGRLENEGSKALARVFESMGSLEEVSMPQNGINHEGIAALAHAFASNPSLRVVDLNDNTFAELGALAMAKALPAMQQLEQINFGDCLVRSKGALAIAEALSEGHGKLRELILASNEINAEGGLAVVEALVNKKHLAKVDLNGNEFGASGVDAVKAAFESHGLSDFLGSLSDDEGSGDEEDNNDETHSGAEESPEDDDEGEEVKDAGLEVRGVGLTPRTEKVQSFDEFIKSPSAANLLAIDNRAEAIVALHKNNADDVGETVKLLNTVSSVVKPGDAAVTSAACQCADTILKQLLTKSPEENVASLLASELLIYMTLIKSEDKKFKPPADPTGLMTVLQHVVQQAYFPKIARDTIRIYVGRLPENYSQKAVSQGVIGLTQALFRA